MRGGEGRGGGNRPARAHEEDVPDLDIAALRGREDVDALVFAALLEFGEGDGVRRGRVVGDAFGLGVAAVVEQDGAAGEAVRGPVVDAAFVVVGDALAVEVAGLAAVVEGLRGHVGHVPEAVPLGAGLRVHGVEIVVGDGGVEGFDGVLKGLAAECWL